MPAMPLALAASAPAPDAFKNFRRVTRAIFVSSLTHLFAASVCATTGQDKLARSSPSPREPYRTAMQQLRRVGRTALPRLETGGHETWLVDGTSPPSCGPSPGAHLYTTIGVNEMTR